MIRPGLLPIAFLIAITLWLVFLRDPPPDICVAGIGTYLPHHHGTALSAECR